MSNYAYLSLWFDDGSPASLIGHAEKLLRLFPMSASEPGLRAFVIRGVNSAEPPLFEHNGFLSAEEVRPYLSGFFQADCAAELRAYWDLWTYQRDGARLEWQQTASPVEFVFHGEAYDETTFAENGHALLTLGFEHLFTGHAGILSGSGAEVNPEQFTSRPEYEFAFALLEPETLETYRTHTRENIRRLLTFERALWTGLPIARRRLWSEGESDLERRLEEVLLHRSSQ
ncbi:MAG: hypothetical protein ACE5H2_06240 [Terriglobia bacterium]